ncbi:hypothetical protein diail_5535 [Diaporthe ilicicola]|nr:hypothetical protein diail_5535 [Diaporthe ilicicola]
MSRSQPQPQAQVQARASPLIPRPAPARPRAKSFSLPNALTRVRPTAARGSWILGHGNDQAEEGNGYAVQTGPRLRLLMPELDRSADQFDEHVLPGIVLLRLYEERSGRLSGKDITEGLVSEELDKGTHLLGSSRVLKNFTPTESGGLAEACFWVVLRQDMFISLTRSQPPSVPLENIMGSSAFSEFDPESIANRMVFLCSRILSFALDPVKGTQPAWWGRLDNEVDAWDKAKPWHFRPLWLQEPSQIKTAATAFPTVRLVRNGHVAGYQHYHLAKMLLAIFDPRLCSNGFETFRRRQQADRIALAHLRTLIGIAISNPEVINSMFTATHAIQACGSCLRDPREREEVVVFLEQMKQMCGWRCQYVINKLREEWKQDYINYWLERSRETSTVFLDHDHDPSMDVIASDT